MTLAHISALFPEVDFVDSHRRLAVDDCRRGAAGAGTSGLAPIALVVDGAAVTIRPGTSVEIVEGIDEDATCVVVFHSASDYADFHNELRSVTGVHLSGAITYERGGYGEFDGWEPALRALYQGRPVYEPTDHDAVHAARTFVHGVDPVEVVGFHVRTHGFAIVRGVFGAEEIAALDAAVTRLEQESTPDTPGTWWTTDADGVDRPCQIHYTTQRSPEMAWIETDVRMTALVEASIPGLVPHPDRGNGVFAVLKHPGARGGMTDLPWHIDCGLGGHTLLCPGLHIGVQLTASTPGVGAFAVLAGSHESSVRRAEVDESTWPVVVVDTRPGDVTIHVPHVFHAAPPPTGDGPGRRTLYLGYGRQEAYDVIGPGRSFDDLLSDTADDGFVSFDEGTARS